MRASISFIPFQSHPYSDPEEIPYQSPSLRSAVAETLRLNYHVNPNQSRRDDRSASALLDRPEFHDERDSADVDE